jgi:hypothetical protein
MLLLGVPGENNHSLPDFKLFNQYGYSNKHYLLDYQKILFMCKMIIILIPLIYNFCVAAAPNLPENLTEFHRICAVVEMKKMEWELEFKRWRSDLGFMESSGDWTNYNANGCIGLYQFKISTLKQLGYSEITFEKFRSDPGIFSQVVQEEALRALTDVNRIALRRFEPCIGQTIGGVLITRSGLLAAAHLGGIRGVKLFLTRNKNSKDSNGTSIRKYLIKFQGYNI